MEFFRKKTNVNFLGIRKWTALFSMTLILISVGSVFTRGINWGLDFTGGYAITVQYQKAPEINKVRAELVKAGVLHAEVIAFGSPKDLMLRLAPKKDMKKQVVTGNRSTEQALLKAKIQRTLGDNVKILQVNYVGPEVGAELAQTGALAMLVAIIAIMVYISLRFDLKFAISAAVALAHDPIIIIGIFSVFQLRFDLTSLAAVLAVIGYSLNDTVVVYDRIRENFRKMRNAPVLEVVNRAINDTLSRTIMTSGLTLIVVVVLFFLGGPSIHGFSLALIIGVIVGTYSSIYVAGALAVVMGLDRQSFIPQPKKTDGLP